MDEYHSKPVNKLAAIVTFKSKDNFRTIAHGCRVRESDFPLPFLTYEQWVHEAHVSAKTGKVSQGNLQRLMVRDRKILDITGLRFGRLTAVGLAKKSKEQKHVWVCRCDCGRYVHRKRKVLTRGDEHRAYLTNDTRVDRCSECSKLETLKRKKEKHAKRMVRVALREEKERRENKWDNSGS